MAVPLTGAQAMAWEAADGAGEGAFGAPAWEVRFLAALAAAPLLSATSLAGILGMSVKGATGLLDGFVAAGIVVEVTHRARRRLFGLAGLAPLRDGTAAPRRPEPGRGPGRPRRPPEEPLPADPPAPLLPALAPLERPRIDYAVLDAAVADCEQAIRATRQALERLLTERQER